MAAQIKITKTRSLHGGAWKVAYADFVTAMMAFFLLLWLLNVATDDQKAALSNFFDPTHPKVSAMSSGAGGVMGGLSMSPQGAMATNKQNVVNDNPSGKANAAVKSAKGQSKKEMAEEKAKDTLRKKEQEAFDKTKEAIEKAIQKNPDLSTLAKNMIIDMTPEGLRIQIVDKDGEPMFASGSARMYEKTRTLLSEVAKIIEPLPNEISIRGHTDSIPYGAGANYTNWELSTDRANASRRVLLASGVKLERINDVVGKADTEHLLPEDPNNAQNRRISIVLLKEELTDPDYAKKVAEASKEFYDEADEEESTESGEDYPEMPPIGTFQRTPGAIEFP